MKRIIFIIPLFFLLLSCEMKDEEHVLSILSWNMYLMCDDIDTGNELPPFKFVMGYTPEQYRKRIRKTVDILSTPEYESDILLLQEIESEKVLRDLLDAGLARHGYKYYGLLEINSPITVGYISKYKPIDTRIHTSLKDRPILELVFRINGEKLYLFNLHARSQINGGSGERRELFTLLDQLMKDRSSHLCVAMGDFNEDPKNGMSMIEYGKEGNPALSVTGDMSEVDYGVYYTPTLDLDLPAQGSVYHLGFHTFDHVLLSDLAFDGRNHEFLTAKLLVPPGGADEEGRPIRYSPEAGIGFSDHFALKAELKYNR